MDAVPALLEEQTMKLDKQEATETPDKDKAESGVGMPALDRITRRASLI